VASWAEEGHGIMSSAEEHVDAAVAAEVASAGFADRALEIGRQAFRDGDLSLADFMLRVAYGHQAGDSIVYLTAVHQRRGRPEVAAAWWTLAQADGWIQDELDAVLATRPR
jgi:hypothetical protein